MPIYQKLIHLFPSGVNFPHKQNPPPQYSSFSPPCCRIIFIRSPRFSTQFHNDHAPCSSVSATSKNTSANTHQPPWCGLQQAILWGLASLIYFGVWRQAGGRAGRATLMCWRTVGGGKRQLLFISVRGRLLWEDEWRGAFQKISESERVGRLQDIIREVLPAALLLWLK